MKGKETAIDAYRAMVLREAACKKETVISDWKRGRSTPKIDKLIKIAKVIDCDVLTLVDEGQKR